MSQTRFTKLDTLVSERLGSRISLAIFFSLKKIFTQEFLLNTLRRQNFLEEEVQG